MRHKKGEFFGLTIETWLSIIGVVVVAAAIVIATLNYEPDELYFEEKLRPTEQVEEILEDRIEAENPDLDFEVNITRETED